MSLLIRFDVVISVVCHRLRPSFLLLSDVCNSPCSATTMLARFYHISPPPRPVDSRNDSRNDFPSFQPEWKWRIWNYFHFHRLWFEFSIVTALGFQVIELLLLLLFFFYEDRMEWIFLLLLCWMKRRRMCRCRVSECFITDDDLSLIRFGGGGEWRLLSHWGQNKCIPISSLPFRIKNE